MRVRSTTFSLPIDDVREIVSVDARDVVTVLGKQTFDVRGELIPLRSVDEVFHWHGIADGRSQFGERSDRWTLLMTRESQIVDFGECRKDDRTAGRRAVG